LIEKLYLPGRWGQLHLRVAGAPGPKRPLLLLHPTPKSGWIYEPLMPALAAGRIVIAPDTPGYGASDPPPEPPSIDDYAHVMLAVVSQLQSIGRIGPGPVDVLGYHTGALIAVAMAALAPAQVANLVLVSLAAYPADLRARKRAALADWPVPRDDGSHLNAMWSQIGALSDPRMDADWKHASLTENMRSGSRAPWGYDAVYRHDFQSALEQMRHPVLILNPEDDLFQPTAANAPRVPQARYVELPGMKHGLFQAESGRIAGLVEDFLASC
jgi:pimeloyl-ACP methyl ester carboxylesterase